jgi:hypothetical protein
VRSPSRKNARHRFQASGATSADCRLTCEIADTTVIRAEISRVLVGQARPKPIIETDAEAVRDAMGVVYPAVDAVGSVLPAMIERGSRQEEFGAVGNSTLNPDDIAETAWEMYSRRDLPEATFNAFG